MDLDHYRDKAARVASHPGRAGRHTRICAAPPSGFTVTFRIVTPALIGGANHKNGPAELRLASVMGALRFWWRALAWGRTAEAPLHDRLDQVADWQAQVFGAPADDNRAGWGQGPVAVRLVDERDITPDHACAAPNFGYADAPYKEKKEDHRKEIQRAKNEDAGERIPSLPWQDSGFGLGYLAGQGISGRKALNPGVQFTIEFRPRKGAPDWLLSAKEDGPPSLIDALQAFALFGAAGSRSRRGFGALQVESVSGADVDFPKTVVELKEKAKEFLERWGSFGTAEPHDDMPYTALSSASRVVVVAGRQGEQVLALHNRAGFDFVKFRSNGNSGQPQNRKIAGRPLPTVGGEPRFWDDHDWFVNHIRQQVTSDTLPKRAIFGLPHNYFSPRGAKNGIAIPSWRNPQEAAINRRGSPVFLTLREFQGQAAAVWLSMPARAWPWSLPRRASDQKRYIQAKMTRGTGRQKQPLGYLDLVAEPDWSPIEDFMDQLNRDYGAGPGGT